MMDRGLFHIFLVIALAVTLSACFVSAANTVLTETEPATDVMATGATLNGAITDMAGTSSVSAFFKYGRDPTLTNIDGTLNIGTLLSEGVFSAEITGLVTGTTYYFQACATTSTGDICDGRSDGIQSFVPEAAAMDIFTEPVTGVTTTDATLGGELTALGGELNVPVYFNYGTNPTTGIDDTLTAESLLGENMVSAGISSLMTGTTYYFQPFAGMNPSVPGVAVGVLTDPATGVTSSSATLHGRLTGMGGERSVPVFFKCGTDPTLTINAPVNVGILSSAGVFSADVFGLKAGTTYYFQACAMTVSSDLHVTGLFCGGILPLSTSGHPPKPTYPTHPTKPTEPTKPTYSPKPTEPTKPTKPTYSPKPTEPTKPTKPTYSPKPTEPTKPTYPPKPTHPTKPTYPPKPTPTSTLTPTPTPTPGGLLEVDFEATEYVGVAPFTVSFKDTTDPAFEATSWLWNFGDRSSSFKQNPVHTYEKPGMYTVTLEVKNNAGITQKIKVVYVIVTGTAKKTDVNDPSVPIVWKGPVVGIDYKTSSITVELAEISVCGYINQDDLICGFEAVGSDSQQINTKISNPDAFGDIRVGDPVIGMSYGDLESGQWLLALARIIKEGNPISIESLFGSRELLDAVLGQISNT